MPGSSKVAIFAAHDIRCRFNPGDVAVGAKAIVEAGSLQAIAMGHFDGVDPSLIQRAGDLLHLRQEYW